MLTRHAVMQRVLDLFESPSYLEIGVNRGETFSQLTASRKVAVDPHFLFDAVDATGPKGIEIYHQVTSDVFFEKLAAKYAPFDVIYLDGLHTFEQTLRDLLNAVVLLSDQGVIVVDDVLPNSYDASLPDLEQVFALRESAPVQGVHWFNDGSWMGDVYKIPFFIQTFMQQFSYATVAENHGQTVLWRSPRPSAAIPQRSVEQVSRLDYRDTIMNRQSFNVQPLDEIIRTRQLRNVAAA